MPPKSGTTSRTSSTPGPLQAEAEALAEKVVFYCNTQSLSSDYLRSDVPRRDRMFEELARSPNAIPYGQDPEQDPLELLKAYDTSLAQKPVTYEEYVLLLCLLLPLDTPAYFLKVTFIVQRMLFRHICCIK